MRRKIKPLIYVFCEGESEIEYIKFLNEKYSDTAVIQRPVKGLFSTADKKFKKDARYRNNAEVTDEIWFFFDVDDGQTGSWEQNKKIYPSIQNTAEKEHIIKMLMEQCPGYANGNPQTTKKIAEHIATAIINGHWVLDRIEGLPSFDDNDIRNRWLYESGLTFTTVQDAVEFL